MITKHDNIIVEKIIRNHYYECQEAISEVEEHFIELYTLYKQANPLKFIKHNKLKKWISFYKGLSFLPSEAENFAFNIKSEIFDSSFYLKFLDKEVSRYRAIELPFYINVTSLSSHISNMDRSNESCIFVEDIVSALGSEYLKEINKLSDEEYYCHTIARKYGYDLLEKIKKVNPVIYTHGDNIVKEHIINGNHRIFHAIKNNVKLPGYIIDAKECVQFGITDDYIKLYDSIVDLNLIKK